MYHDSSNKRKALQAACWAARWAARWANLLLFFLFAAFLAEAGASEKHAPYSFFLSANQILSNSDAVRIYRLEYAPSFANILPANLPDLFNISGTVKVAYSGGREQEMDFRQLLANKAVGVALYDSGEHAGIFFTDASIARITTGSTGLRFLRRDCADYENRLASNNIQQILELEKLRYSHSAIQEHILRNRILNITRTDAKLVIDFQTTKAEAEKVTGTFAGSATVSYRRDKSLFLRVDGLLSRSVEMNAQTTELLTHYHTDHINHATAERCLGDGKLFRLIAPYPLLNASKTKTFYLLAEAAGLADPEVSPASRTLEIIPGNKVRGSAANGIQPLNLTAAAIGGFDYASYSAANDITVEMFRYYTARDVNADGIIYRITHKNVSYMLFGDFDDPEGINTLLEIAKAHEKTRIELLEERALLHARLIKAQSEKAPAADIQNKINALNERLSGLVNLKADIVKWPHHAHKFPNNEAANNIIIKLKEVIDPQYIIWQRHHTQNGFTDYIQRYKFTDKFLSSDEVEVHIISMELYLTANAHFPG